MANITQISSAAKTWIKGSKSVVTTPKTVNVQELISGLKYFIGVGKSPVITSPTS